METYVALLVLLAMANVSLADDTVFAWPTNNDSPRVSLDDKSNLVVQGEAKPTTTMVLTLNSPKAPSHKYRLVGRIKYENVVGEGYVEMWNHFPKQGPFFSKTLAPEGKLGKITGTSDWRDLELPFYSKPGMLPTKLVVNVVLPGTGKVWLTPLTMQKAEPTDMDEEATAFPWPLLAGFLSGLVGLLGTMVGFLAGNPATRRLALQLTMFLIPCSCAALLVGVVLWARETNHAVWYPLALVGGLWLAAFAVSAFVLRRRLSHEELRRIQALDASAR